MTFVKVFDKDDEIVDLNVSLILKVEKRKEDFCFERAIITDVLGNKYQSLARYEDFLIKVCIDDKEVLKDLLK
ncbi:hypothetical protein SAMN04487977_101516 [Treponema bryantii]|uniref:Uncharacterized protein n=1 Tax=Treponema bryantii TaxID=163 RepID=A0A1H9AZC5_9SPIR|nr:hypothetical protein [Treponema bryantii]SEP81783.1 hypothetical protein SAMN04487977_101516 [Treponema bryantii]